jgi:hypothetical protein
MARELKRHKHCERQSDDDELREYAVGIFAGLIRGLMYRHDRNLVHATPLCAFGHNRLAG